MAALLAALLGMNIAWLFGFTSFLLGACLFPLTLGVWWTGRDRLGWGRVAALAALLVLGYFGHLVSLGLTVVGLAVLAALTPCRRERPGGGSPCLGRPPGPDGAGRALPLVPLGLVYLNLSRRGGPLRPEWGHLTNPLSLRAWAVQLTWADPISIAAKSHAAVQHRPEPRRRTARAGRLAAGSRSGWPWRHVPRSRRRPSGPPRGGAGSCSRRF